jgi:hypothetical protein
MGWMAFATIETENREDLDLFNRFSTGFQRTSIQFPELIMA